MGSRFLSHSRAIKPNFEEEEESQIEDTDGRLETVERGKKKELIAGEDFSCLACGCG